MGSAYMTGFVQGRAWGIATVFGTHCLWIDLLRRTFIVNAILRFSLIGPGQTYVAGVGVYNWHGGATCSYAISTAFFGVGGSLYDGAGQVLLNGIAQISTAITQSNVREYVPKVSFCIVFA